MLLKRLRSEHTSEDLFIVKRKKSETELRQGQSYLLRIAKKTLLDQLQVARKLILKYQTKRKEEQCHNI